jgi:adenosylmethionine-8-amino-7-oxononanoate aminotransferase
VQQTIVEEQLLGRARQQGARLHELLMERFGGHEHVGDVRGRGLFLGLELVAERSTKRPFAPERRLHARVKSEALARGLMCYPNGGTIDGHHGDHVLLAPPFIVTDADLETIVERLAAAIDAALATVDQAAA